MTKEPYVVNNLLLCTVLSYDITVESEGMIAWGGSLVPPGGRG